MLQLRYDCEARRSGGQRINFDHVGFYNVYPTHGTWAFLHFALIEMRPGFHPAPLAAQHQSLYAITAGYNVRYNCSRCDRWYILHRRLWLGTRCFTYLLPILVSVRMISQMAALPRRNCNFAPVSCNSCTMLSAHQFHYSTVHSVA